MDKRNIRVGIHRGVFGARSGATVVELRGYVPATVFLLKGEAADGVQ